MQVQVFSEIAGESRTRSDSSGDLLSLDHCQNKAKEKISISEERTQLDRALG